MLSNLHTIVCLVPVVIKTIGAYGHMTVLAFSTSAPGQTFSSSKAFFPTQDLPYNSSSVGKVQLRISELYLPILRLHCKYAFLRKFLMAHLG